jgi:hypothetical protein
MKKEKIEELGSRLKSAVETLNLQSQVSAIFYDYVEDIMTIELNFGVDKIGFYSAIEKLHILKKDDQITITWK